LKINPELKKLNREGLISILLPGYKINKWIIGSFFFASVFIILTGLYLDNGLNFEDNNYLVCNDTRPCVNPYYSPFVTDCPAGFDCSREYLYPGEEWGVKPIRNRP